MKYKIELTEQEISVLGAALGKMPYDTVAPLIQNLQMQVTPQVPLHIPAAPPLPTETAKKAEEPVMQ